MELRADMLLTVHVKTNAHVSEILGWLDENTLKVAVAAAPEKGKANQELIRLLAKQFKISMSNIDIVRGKTTRIKQVAIKNGKINT